MIIYDKSGVQIVDILVLDTSYRYKAIMGENTLTLYFSLPYFIEIPEGAYVDFKDEKYFLLKPENFIQRHTENFEYTLLLDSYQSLTKYVKFKYFTMADGVVNSSYELKFSLTFTLIQFAQLLVDNMNIADSVGGWNVGNCITADPIVLDFNHDYCFDVLAKLVASDAFDTEWEIINKTINIGTVEKLKDTPLPLKYGYNCGLIPGTSRVNVSTSNAITRLFVEGSDRNIDQSTYGSSTLLMPKNTSITYEGINYKTDATGTYVERATSIGRLVEDSLDTTKIYPKRIGTISQVNTVDALTHLYDIIDASIPDELDFSKQVIAGETMTIVFQTGQLAGKEFNVSYHPSTKRFEIVPTSDNGNYYPSESIIPDVGDTYAVFHISLPTAYITTAETDVLNAAVKYLYENETQKYTYTSTLDELYAKRNWLTIGGFLDCGYFVALSSDQFLISPVDIRITAIKEYLNKPQQPEITLSNEVTGTILSTTLNKIPTQEQATDRKDGETLRYTKRQFADVKQTTEMLQSSLLNFSSSVSPITVNTMQLVAGDETLQFDFVINQNSTTALFHSEVYDSTAKQFSSDAGILQHKTLGINTISSSHTASEYKWWSIPAYISPVLDDANKSYYLYARVNKDDNSGVFLLRETAISIDGDEGYYHLLMGIINSEIDGDRSYSRLYGFTEVLPGRIITDKVVSSNGQTYFDLLNNKIKGYIEFMDGLIAGMIKLSSNGTVTAGLQGDSDVNVAFWAGGTYEDALAGTAKTIDYKDGAFQRGGGSYRGDAAGNIITDMAFKAREGYLANFSIFENSILNDSIEISDTPIESLSEMINPTDIVINRDINWTKRAKKTVLAYASGLMVTRAGMCNFQVFANIDGARQTDILYPASSTELTGHSAEFSVTVIIQDSTNYTVFSKKAECGDDGVVDMSIDTVLPIGVYKISALAIHKDADTYINAEIIGNYSNPTTGGIEVIGNENKIGIYRPVNNTKIGSDGFYSELDALRYFYYKSTEGLKYKGAARFYNDAYRTHVYDDNLEPIISNINSYTSFILDRYSNDSTSLRVIHLPSPLDIEDGVDNFTLKVLIGSSNGKITRIDQKTNSHFYDDNGNVFNYINLEVGDSIELRAVRELDEMRYFLIKNGGEIH